MGFFDLNIPYSESDRHATDKSSLNMRRLKLVLKAMELGYTGIAYNRTLKGVMSESHRCSTPLFPLSKFSSSSSFFAAVEFHRNLLNVPVSSSFRQYTRLTVVVDIPTQASALNVGNPILRSYDIVAVRPMNQNAFDQACQTSEVDMISIDFAEKLPFRLKQPMVKAAIKRGVYFEITYSGLIVDPQSRRQMISNCKLLVDWTRGKNLILSSAAPSVTEFRGPQDVANLVSLLGLPMEHAKAAISKNCRSLLANALRKKHFYKEAIKVEEIPSGGQMNSEQSAFDDWLKWDPITSGEGDLLLDEMKKSFTISSTVKKTVKTIDFTAAMNGLPAHGLQIKDLVSGTDAAPELPDIGNCVSAGMETEVAVTAPVKPTMPDGLNPLSEEHDILPEDQINHETVTNERGRIFPTQPQASPFSVSYIHEVSSNQDSPVPLVCLPKGSVTLLPPCGGGQTVLNDAKIKPQAFGSSTSMMSYFPTNAGVSTNLGEAPSTLSEKLSCSDDMETDHVVPGKPMQHTQLQGCGGNALPDGGLVFDTTAKNEEGIPISDKNALMELSDPSSKVPNMIDGDEIINTSVTSRDGLHIKELLNLKKNFNEAISVDVMAEGRKTDSITNRRLGKALKGRERRKPNPLCRPFSSPFKRFLNPRPLKRKASK